MMIQGNLPRLSFFSFALTFAAAACFGQASPKKFIDNEDLRVLEVEVQPHVKQKLHEHKIGRVMIYRVAGAEKFDFGDGRPSMVLRFRENDVKWSAPEGMHAPEVISDKPLDIVEIELKKPPTGKKITTSLDPLKVDPKHYKLEFENDQVRVVRVRFGPNESAPLHEHQLDRVNFYVTDAEIRVTGADGKVSMVPRKAGDVVQGSAGKHSETNMTDKAVEVIMTELK